MDVGTIGYYRFSTVHKLAVDLVFASSKSKPVDSRTDTK